MPSIGHPNECARCDVCAHPWIRIFRHLGIFLGDWNLLPGVDGSRGAVLAGVGDEGAEFAPAGATIRIAAEGRG